MDLVLFPTGQSSIASEIFFVLVYIFLVTCKFGPLACSPNEWLTSATVDYDLTFM